MRILIFGVGSIFAGKLINAGYDVTMLARNDRYKELASNGLVLRNAISGQLETYYPELINNLLSDDIYDYCLIQ